MNNGNTHGRQQWKANEEVGCLLCQIHFIVACSFDLTLDTENGRYAYTPVNTPSHFPAYLNEEIDFDTDQAQLFFWRIFNYLMEMPGKGDSKK